jgi:hypothetical protein
MRKLLTCLLIVVTGTALLSCDAPRADAPSPPSLAYEPPAPIDRTPLPPPPGSASAADVASPVEADGSSPDAGSTLPSSGRMIWHTSPRWAAVKGNDQIEVEQDQ